MQSSAQTEEGASLRRLLSFLVRGSRYLTQDAPNNESGAEASVRYTGDLISRGAVDEPFGLDGVRSIGTGGRSFIPCRRRRDVKDHGRSLRATPALACRKDHRRPRRLREVEVLQQIPEQSRFFSSLGPPVGASIGPGIQALGSEEVVLDELQIAIEA